MPIVALRKESVDRNFDTVQIIIVIVQSLSARRAWIEIGLMKADTSKHLVALRKESVDRNNTQISKVKKGQASLSARRAWIEMQDQFLRFGPRESLSARRAWIEIHHQGDARRSQGGRSPQGERG